LGAPEGHKPVRLQYHPLYFRGISFFDKTVFIHLTQSYSKPNIPQTYRIIVFADVTENYIKLTPIPNNTPTKPASPVTKAAKAKPTRGSNLALGSAASNNAARNNYMKVWIVRMKNGCYLTLF